MLEKRHFFASKINFSENQRVGVLFFTCSNFGMYENYHITVHLLIWNLIPSKITLFSIENINPNLWIIKLSHDSPGLENAFWIIAIPNKSFPSRLLRPFQFCQLRLFLFFFAFDRGALRSFRSFSRIWNLTSWPFSFHSQ